MRAWYYASFDGSGKEGEAANVAAIIAMGGAGGALGCKGSITIYLPRLSGAKEGRVMQDVLRY
jgi:hypothetical protein